MRGERYSRLSVILVSNIFRPSRGSNNFINATPTAHAVGYILSPLTGLILY
jgi:hypothetical protein